MPIKEIIAISAVIMASIIAAHPTRSRKAIRDFQFKILREVGRTDNWGKPSKFYPPVRARNPASRVTVGAGQ